MVPTRLVIRVAPEGAVPQGKKRPADTIKDRKEIASHPQVIPLGTNSPGPVVTVINLHAMPAEADGRIHMNKAGTQVSGPLQIGTDPGTDRGPQ